MEIIQIAAVAIITALAYSLLKQLRPEMAPLIIPSGLVVLLIFSLESFAELSGGAGSLLAIAGIESENVEILLKCLAICVITQLASNICCDNSCLALSGAVELCGKAMVLIAAMPILKSMAALAIGMIGG